MNWKNLKEALAFMAQQFPATVGNIVLRDNLMALFQRAEKAEAESLEARQNVSKALGELGEATRARLKAIAERDEARAACAEMRPALESALAAVWDGHYSGKGVVVAYAQAVDKEIKHALSSTCGKGWLSPEKKKVLVEALEHIAAVRGVCSTYCGCSGCVAGKALSTLKGDMSR